MRHAEVGWTQEDLQDWTRDAARGLSRGAPWDLGRLSTELARFLGWGVETRVTVEDRGNGIYALHASATVEGEEFHAHVLFREPKGAR